MVRPLTVSRFISAGRIEMGHDSHFRFYHFLAPNRKAKKSEPRNKRNRVGSSSKWGIL